VQPSILVTGGAGFLGINLCRHLLDRGYRVRSMDIADFVYPERGQIDAMLADIRDPAAVDRAMTGMDMVVHCAAALPLASKEEIQSTDVGGTKTLLESAARRAIARFIYISSTSVYGIPDHHPVYERDRLQGVGPYGAAKISAEQLCLEARANGGCVPILRPKSFVGPERLGVFELLYDWAYEGRNFPVLGAGQNLYQLLDVADLCEVISRCLTCDVQTGQRHLQRGRQGVRYDARELSGGARSRRTWQARDRRARETGDRAPQAARGPALCRRCTNGSMRRPRATASYRLNAWRPGWSFAPQYSNRKGAHPQL
jgi:nucleoside-diphosphate-sugar epimerase